MSLFVIGDLHLSLGADKPMNIFPGWDNHVQRLESAWRRLVSPEDTVVVPGDISWSMTLEGALEDFRFVDSLPGTKIILKGNHDYWWGTAAKITAWFEKNGISTVRVLHNNSYIAEGVAICGTRGWFFEKGEKHSEKILQREAIRLKLSCDSVPKDFSGERIVFLHYPPIYSNFKVQGMLDAVKQTGARRCFYCHVHGESIPFAFNGEEDGVRYQLASADYLGFKPFYINKM